MANPYPANFETLEGGGRLTGQVNFTDPANQPGGSQPVQVVGPFRVTHSDVGFHTVYMPALGTIFLRAWLVTMVQWAGTGLPAAGITAALTLTSDAAGSADIVAYKNLETEPAWGSGGNFGWSEATQPITTGSYPLVGAVTFGTNPVFEFSYDAGGGSVSAGEADIYALILAP